MEMKSINNDQCQNQPNNASKLSKVSKKYNKTFDVSKPYKKQVFLEQSIEHELIPKHCNNKTENDSKNQSQSILCLIRQNKKNINNNELRKTVGTLNFLSHKRLQDRLLAQRKRAYLKKIQKIQDQQQQSRSNLSNDEQQWEEQIQYFRQTHQKVLTELANTIYSMDQINLVLEWLQKPQAQNKTKLQSVETPKIPEIMTDHQQPKNPKEKQRQIQGSRSITDDPNSTLDTSKKEQSFESFVYISEVKVVEDQPKAQLQKRQKDIGFHTPQLQPQQPSDKDFSKKAISLWQNMSQLPPKRSRKQLLTQQAKEQIMIEQIKNQQVESLKALYMLEREEKSSQILNESMIQGNLQHLFKNIKRNCRHDKLILKVILQLKEQTQRLEHLIFQGLKSTSNKKWQQLKWLEKMKERLQSSHSFSLQEKSMILQNSSPIIRPQRQKQKINRKKLSNQNIRYFQGTSYNLDNPLELKEFQQNRKKYRRIWKSHQRQVQRKISKNQKQRKIFEIEKIVYELRLLQQQEQQYLIDQKIKELLRNFQRNRPLLKRYFSEFELKNQYLECQSKLLDLIIHGIGKQQNQVKQIEALEQQAQYKLKKLKRVYAVIAGNTKNVVARSTKKNLIVINSKTEKQEMSRLFENLEINKERD